MASIYQLIKDVDQLLETKGWFNDSLMADFEKQVSMRMQKHFNDEQKGRLRLSKLSPKECERALWYSVHHPELAEPLSGNAMFKYAYGHLIEALAICAAKAAGHSVTGEQDEINVDGVLGHRDCVIDGCVVDVKSANSRSYQKFKDKTLAQNDDFGYLEQIDAYVVGSADDPLVTNKESGFFWAIDKELGKMCLYEHLARPDYIRSRIKRAKDVAALVSPPTCQCGTVKDGEGGNIKLDVKASYSAYKFCCFPSLRTFLYEGGPRYLTKVVKRPMRQDRVTPIPEVDKHGRFVN